MKQATIKIKGDKKVLIEILEKLLEYDVEIDFEIKEIQYTASSTTTYLDGAQSTPTSDATGTYFPDK